ncbi:MAG: hypothetical protein KIT76_17680, partial [Pseudolabrys sp.]|nr:hypothetical protein [Pseudolabrys sp.]
MPREIAASAHLDGMSISERMDRLHDRVRRQDDGQSSDDKKKRREDELMASGAASMADHSRLGRGLASLMG